MSKFLSSLVKRTEPYVPGEQINRPNLLKLNTNENPYPPSPDVFTAIQEEMEQNLQLYPSPTADTLREEIARFFSLNKDQVFVGNGSDEVLAFSFMAFFEPGEAIRFPAITYSFYPVYAKIFDISYEEVPLNDDFTMQVADFDNSPGGVIFPNPNAPTSIYLPLDEVKHILDHNPDKVVIIDEAYIDFAGESSVKLVDDYENLLVIQTTSKSRSLAGLRVGYALGQKPLIDALIRIKDSVNSYTIDRLALVGATASFKDSKFFTDTTNKIIRTREQTTSWLEDLGFKVIPSDTNFVFATHPDHDAKTLYEELKNHDVLVRHFDAAPIDQYIRVTIGTDENMAQFIEALKKLLS